QTLLIFDKVLNNGFDGGHFISGLATHIRNLLVSKEPSTLKLLEVSENIKRKYLDQSQALSSGLLLSALNIANQCEIQYKSSKNQRLQVELALLKMCHIASAILLSKQGIQSPSAAAEVKKKLPEESVSKPAPVANTVPAPKPVPSEPRAIPTPKPAAPEPAV